MIRQLKISNYALISELQLQPASGFNIITGETGAGKSIIMGALSLLRGKRADSRSLGTRDKKSVVSATFDITEAITDAVSSVLQAYNIPAADDGSLILTREISPSGRSKATVNSVPVPLTAMEQLSELLVDIHSQHQNRVLTESAYQLSVLDNLAENGSLLDDYRRIYASYRRALKKYADTREEIQATEADTDYLEFQLQEFSRLDLKENEEELLEQQRESLATSAEICKRLSEAAALISETDHSATEQLWEAFSSLKAAAQLSENFNPLVERLESITSELDDIGRTVVAETSALRDDPATLEYIEERLGRIHALMSKHRVDSYEALLAIRDRLAARLATLADSDGLLRRLETEARALKRQAMEKAAEISARRKAAASSLAEELTRRARPLGMPNFSAEIRVESGKLNPDGADTVNFLFAFNRNQEPSPVANHASGGEISRVMLALKSITASHRHLPTIIFDEIDTGVSGEVGRQMGLLMKDISRFMQVVTITHLPQVASLGDLHYKVFKCDDDNATHTRISLLDREGRRAELALMLGGNSAGEEALATADFLLNEL